MKIFLIMLFATVAFAQRGPLTPNQKASGQARFEKFKDDALKGQVKNADTIVTGKVVTQKHGATVSGQAWTEITVIPQSVIKGTVGKSITVRIPEAPAFKEALNLERGTQERVFLLASDGQVGKYVVWFANDVQPMSKLGLIKGFLRQ